MIHRWKNVVGGMSAVIRAPSTDWGWANEEGDEFPQGLQDVLGELLPDAGFYDDHTYELEMGFLSSGYDDPGCTYGEPEDCYPPDSEEERVLNHVVIWQGTDPYPIPEEAWGMIYDWYKEAIYNVKVDTNGRSWED